MFKITPAGLVAAIVAGLAFQASASAEPISLNGSTTVANTIVTPKKAERHGLGLKRDGHRRTHGHAESQLTTGGATGLANLRAGSSVGSEACWEASN